MSKRLQVGEKVTIRGMVATVLSKPARASGMQTVQFDGIQGLFGFEWWHWKKLIEIRDSNRKQERNDAP